MTLLKANRDFEKQINKEIGDSVEVILERKNPDGGRYVEIKKGRERENHFVGVEYGGLSVVKVINEEFFHLYLTSLEKSHKKRDFLISVENEKTVTWGERDFDSGEKIKKEDIKHEFKNDFLQLNETAADFLTEKDSYVANGKFYNTTNELLYSVLKELNGFGEKIEAFGSGYDFFNLIAIGYSSLEFEVFKGNTILNIRAVMNKENGYCLDTQVSIGKGGNVIGSYVLEIASFWEEIEKIVNEKKTEAALFFLMNPPIEVITKKIYQTMVGNQGNRIPEYTIGKIEESFKQNLDVEDILKRIDEVEVAYTSLYNGHFFAVDDMVFGVLEAPEDEVIAFPKKLLEDPARKEEMALVLTKMNKRKLEKDIEQLKRYL